MARRSVDDQEEAIGEEVELLDVVIDRHIRRVLERCRGNRSEAARRLGMHRRSLQRRLNRTSTKTSLRG